MPCHAIPFNRHTITTSKAVSIFICQNDALCFQPQHKNICACVCVWLILSVNCVLRKHVLVCAGVSFFLLSFLVLFWFVFIFFFLLLLFLFSYCISSAFASFYRIPFHIHSGFIHAKITNIRTYTHTHTEYALCFMCKFSS